MRQVLSSMNSGMAEKYRLPLDCLPRRRPPPRFLEHAGTDFIPFPGRNRWYDHPAGHGRSRIGCRGHIDSTLHRLDPEVLPLDRSTHRGATVTRASRPRENLEPTGTYAVHRKSCCGRGRG
jgi:hypothetical protein